MRKNNYALGPLKRGIDFVVSMLLSIPVGLLVLAMSVIVRLESPGNPLFVQTRVGLEGREFRIWKIRTLYRDKFTILARDAELEWNDQRITRVGRWLRRSKLDELPQLFNVLVGDMSLVGPRPDIPQQVVAYTEEQLERLTVRPGLTGAVQISGNTQHSWDKRIEVDRWYIANATLRLDLQILGWTFVAICRGEDEDADPLGAVAETLLVSEPVGPSVNGQSYCPVPSSTSIA